MIECKTSNMRAMFRKEHPVARAFRMVFHGRRTISADSACLANEDETNLLEDLAREGNFDRIGEILTHSITPTHWLSSSSGRNVLHTLCLYQPTEAVVKAMMSKLSPTCDLEVDAKGRTPLHLAVKNGASSAVIRQILGAEGSAASVQDSAGRYPLHYICHNIASNNNTERQQNGHCEIIEILLEAYPAAVTARDNQGKNPLDLAVEAKHNDPSIVPELNFAARILQMKSNKKMSTRSNETSSTLSLSQSRSSESDFFADLEIPASYHDDDVSSIGSRGVSRNPNEDPICSKLFEYTRVSL